MPPHPGHSSIRNPRTFPPTTRFLSSRPSRPPPFSPRGPGGGGGIGVWGPPPEGVKPPQNFPIPAMGALRFGTSGWSYEEWLGVFYETASESKLAAYSKVFNTAEIDSSFYRAPTEGMVLGWLRYTPEDFVFAAKVPQTVTHDHRLDVANHAEEDVRAFCELMDPLNDAGKLGPLLLQLPPSLRFDPGIVRRFFEALPHRYLWAIEFRNKSWLVPEADHLPRELPVAH